MVFDERSSLAELLKKDGFTILDANLSNRSEKSSRCDRLAGSAQYRFWLQERTEGIPGLNTLGCLVRFSRSLSASSLNLAFEKLFQRHEALRTRFEETSDGVFERIDVVAPKDVEYLEGDSSDCGLLERQLARRLRMNEGPLWRASIFSDPTAANTLLLVFHHAIIDWTGIGRLVEELEQLLSNPDDTNLLLDDPFQPADYYYWRTATSNEVKIKADQSYWLERLAGELPVLDLPAARRSGRGLGRRSTYTALTFAPQLVRDIRQFAVANGTTPFFVFLAAYAGVLGRFALSEDVSIGTAIDNRDTPGSETIVGCLSDLVVLRCDLSGEPSFKVLVQKLQRVCSTDFKHTTIGYADVVALVKPQRRAGVAPLFQALFNFLPARGGADLPTLMPLPSPDARADIALELVDDGVGISGQIEVREDLVPKSVAIAITTAISTTLQSAMARPDIAFNRLPLIDSQAAAALTQRLNPSHLETINQSLGDLLLERARLHSNKIALCEGDRTLDYKTLIKQATALAHFLVAQTPVEKPTVGFPIAICLDRSIDLVIAAVAVVLAGGAVLFLEPDLPEERLASLLADSGATRLIARQRPVWLPESAAVTIVTLTDYDTKNTAKALVSLPRVSPEDPAYLIYTSGSTGRPKVVVGLHKGMVNRILWMERQWPVQPDEAICLKTSLMFVDCIGEIFGPLIWGLRAVVADRDTALNPRALATLIARERISRIVMVPSLLRAMLDRVPDIESKLRSLRLCVSSGETLPVQLVQRFYTVVPDAALVNFYGSSEVSADATWHRVDISDTAPIPIGVPIQGNRIFVLDRAGQVLPVGAPGQIAISGVGVARGYLHGNSSAFQRNLNDDKPTEKPIDEPIFATGDLGLWDGDGRLVYLGRMDRQVKIQGVRVEPTEIEATLEDHPGVDAAYVSATVAPPEDNMVLTAYVAAEAGVTVASLRAWLSHRLPRALIPASFMILDALPLNASGKIDLAALPSPARDLDTDAEIPKTDILDPLEELVANVWSEMLAQPINSPDDDFFDCGGGSLQAIMAINQISELMDSAIAVSTLFETPSLRAFVRRIITPDVEGLPPPCPSLETGLAPATSNQRWLWTHYQDDPNSSAYNLCIAYELNGSLDVPQLESAIRHLVTRHDALRTHLAIQNDELVQVVTSEELELFRHDVSAAVDPVAVLESLLADIRCRPFALERELPLRVHLVKLEPVRHVLIWVNHHVACDGWSGQVLVKELAALWSVHSTTALPPPLLQLGDIARWQQTVCPAIAKQLKDYQQSLMGGESPRLSGIATDKTWGGQVAVDQVVIGTDTLTAFEALAQEERVTRFISMLTIWAVLLTRFGDTEHPLLGFPQAGRNTPGLQSVVGFLANTVLLKVDLADAPTFRQAFKATKTALLTAMRYQDVPLPWLQATGMGWPTQPDSEAIRSMVIVEDASDWDLRLPELSSRLFAMPNSPEARVDLAFVVTQMTNGPRLVIEYATRRVPRAVAERLARGLEQLMAAAATEPDTQIERLPLLSIDNPDCGAVLTAEAASSPIATRLDAVLAHVALTSPAATAVWDLTSSLSYAELNQRASVTAQRLQGLGVGTGDRVGLLAQPSPLQLASLFGVWRLGAVAVPLDPTYPRERIAATLMDAGVVAVLTDIPLDYPCPQLSLDSILGAVPSAPIAGLVSSPDPDDVAAIIYTSGTTGTPKGVMITQAALCRLGCALSMAYDLGQGDRVLQVVSPAFDVALSDIAMAVSAVATLVVPPHVDVMPGKHLNRTLAMANITHMQVPAAVLAATQPGTLPKLRTVSVGGEVCSPETANAWSCDRRLFIAYGPTEATVTVALATYQKGARPGTIGRPFGGASLTVVDPTGHLVPIGVAGELIIGGPGVALGYLGLPDLTAERFEQTAQGRRYRTGDRVRMEADGTVTFLGRIDRQLKLRGFRIEPGEVETHLMNCDGVAQALVSVCPDQIGEPQLVAWVVGEPGAKLDSLTLRQALKQHLPNHLVPSAIVQIVAVPLTANRKVDWSSLKAEFHRLNVPDMNISEMAQCSLVERDSTTVERDLSTIWSELLGRNQVGLDISFFDLGGHSIQLVRLQTRIEDHFGIELPIGEMFANPTLRSMTSLVQRLLRTAASDEENDWEEFTL
ncbi:non-ribosomal peptide synthetase [Microcystis sp. M169S2]|uniref:non-ribosomal peptide synthetase n=1 Tax=Microcystis sp. M169S2 TaxID=2771157 RepID=UPI0025888037|nr:non-ribosomal peptide synthetase [Microcystis sp. M169S2]MCA2719598.1 amino acid adenylation domain-containing protein [Microcystis sp. M169S2]